MAQSSIALVDTGRPTVSHGTLVSDSRTLTTLIWRPDASGRRPLLVFAHGFQVGPAPYFSLLAAWAAAGYVVAAPEFPLTDEAVAGARLDENDIQSQPGDVRFVVDSLVAPTSAVAGAIDPSKVVLAGHSDGAETVLAESQAPVPPGEPPIVAVACFGVAPLPEQRSTLNPPILVGQGDSDTINPASYGMQAYAAARSPKYYFDLLGANHLPPLQAGSRWLPTVVATTLAFFDLYIWGEGSPASVIETGDVASIAQISAG